MSVDLDYLTNYDNNVFLSDLKENLDATYDIFYAIKELVETSKTLSEEEIADFDPKQWFDELIWDEIKDLLDSHLESYIQEIADEAYEDGDGAGYDRGYESAEEEYEDHISPNDIDDYYFHIDYVYENYVLTETYDQKVEELQDKINELTEELDKQDEIDELKEQITELETQLAMQESPEDIRAAIYADVKAELEAEQLVSSALVDF